MSTPLSPTKIALDQCLDWAIAHDDYSCIQPWLNAGATPDPASPLLDACLEGAIDTNNLVCANLLLQIGANPNAKTAWDENLVNRARIQPMVALLHAHGANIDRIHGEASRVLLGLEPEKDDRLLTCSAADFERHHAPQYASTNGQNITSSFHLCMIESGESAYAAGKHFQLKRSFSDPSWKHIWNVDRFGQSTTLLPDGRYIQIGGEHEDYYDPDFFIYNDVIVHTPPTAESEPWQRQVFAYPADVFPPTDFHTATLMGDEIIVIGNLGYMDARVPGYTPVYALNIISLQFRPISCSGSSPGWIHQHRATPARSGVISVNEGSELNEHKKFHSQQGTWELDVAAARWTQVR